LVLHEISDQMLAHLIALLEESEAPSPAARVTLVTTLDEIGATVSARSPRRSKWRLEDHMS